MSQFTKEQEALLRTNTVESARETAKLMLQQHEFVASIYQSMDQADTWWTATNYGGFPHMIIGLGPGHRCKHGEGK